MRLDSVLPLPKQLMLGAAPDAALAYTYGRVIGIQCRRWVFIWITHRWWMWTTIPTTRWSMIVLLRRQIQSVALWCATHERNEWCGHYDLCQTFSRHGDTETDSHFDLPVIQKSRSELDSLELHPFREMIRENVHSVMVGHLYIPAIDNTKILQTSLSYNNVTKLLRDELQFKGLIITDGLEMKGVTKFFRMVKPLFRHW